MTPLNYQLFSKILLKHPSRLELSPSTYWIAIAVYSDLMNYPTSKGSLFSLLYDEWFVSIAHERYSP